MYKRKKNLYSTGELLNIKPMTDQEIDDEYKKLLKELEEPKKLVQKEKLPTGTLGAAGAGLEILGDSVNMAKTPDTHALQAQIDMQANTNFAGSNNQLLAQANAYRPMDKQSYSDIGGISNGEIASGAGKNALIGATAGMAFGPWGAAIGGIVGAGAGLVGGLIGRNKAKEAQRGMNRQIARANATAVGNLNNAISNNMNSTIAQNQINYAAEGGQLDTTYPSPLTFFNNGGTHEQNPNDGILQGYDQEGTPNLVEEGEVKWNDYIFSNRNGLNKELIDKYNLPKNLKDNSFAKAAEKLYAEAKERPNDPISKRGLNASLSKLANAQEEYNAKEEEKRQQFAQDYAEKQIANDPEAMQAIQEQQMAEQQAAEQQMAQEQMMQQMPQDMMANGGNLFLRGGIPDMYTNPYKTFIETPVFYPDMQLNNNTTFGNARSILQTTPYVNPYSGQYKMTTQRVGIDGPVTKNTDTSTNNNTSDVKVSNTKTSARPTWMRYAPLIGGAFNVLSDIAGWNEPDYRNADLLKQAINAGNEPITYNPIGNYLTYKPIDSYYKGIQARQANAATNNALMNNANGNRSASQYVTMVNNNNLMQGLGNIENAAQRENLAQRNQVETFNRATNQANSEMDLSAKKARHDQQAQRISAINNYVNMLNALDNSYSTAASANLTSLLQNIGEVGRENVAWNMIENSPSLYYKYGINPFAEGLIKYDNYKEANTGKNGGKIITRNTNYLTIK